MEGRQNTKKGRDGVERRIWEFDNGGRVKERDRIRREVNQVLDTVPRAISLGDVLSDG